MIYDLRYPVGGLLPCRPYLLDHISGPADILVHAVPSCPPSSSENDIFVPDIWDEIALGLRYKDYFDWVGENRSLTPPCPLSDFESGGKVWIWTEWPEDALNIVSLLDSMSKYSLDNYRVLCPNKLPKLNALSGDPSGKNSYLFGAPIWKQLICFKPSVGYSPNLMGTHLQIVTLNTYENETH